MELNWSLQIAEYVDGLFLFGPQMEESDISIRVCIYIYLCTCMYVYTYMCKYKEDSHDKEIWNCEDRVAA